MNTDSKSERIIEVQTEAPDSYPQQELTGKILECAFAVHNTLGAGFLERVYANALTVEIRAKVLKCVQELPLKVNYKGIIVGDYAADMVVEDSVLIELKSCAVLDQNHRAQIINYLRASGIRVGLLINFGRPRLEYERFVY
jgi:GxxExxY protein